MDMSMPTFEFPGVRGIQGEKSYYTTAIPFRALARLLAIDTGNTMDRSQREVDQRRAAAVTSYIQNNPSGFVLPSLTGVISHSDIDFSEHKEGSLVGTIKLSMDAEIKLFDGQHRAVGIINLVKQSPELAYNTIPVQLFTDMSLVSRQQAFADINSTAKTVSASLNSAYDHRNTSAQHIAKMIDKVDGWINQIEWDKAACAGKSEKLFPFKAVIDATRLFLGKGSRDDITEHDAYCAGDFWARAVVPAQWRNPRLWPDHSCVAGRESYITYHVVGLKALALWGRQVIESGTDIEVGIDRLCKVAPFSRYASHWEGKCTDSEGRMKSNKDALIATVRYLCLITDIKPSSSLGQ
ncbi:DNA sulfur modification protein DndB [Aeromonas veronii]|uniref:DNA sulfur modification protein DndB n=1 Tax=Aeromonas veronii TaxID=654 RepID=UPI001302483A|nr:DNA sulfur modification protein DndB [Aeromonas veronii]KAE9622548.1 DGQHR domain-containing protein [Aeromonas veronii]